MTSNQTVVAEATLPTERLAKVDAARQGWIRKLVDLSRRNNLLYFRELKVGTLDLSDAPEGRILALLQSGNKPGGGIPHRGDIEERASHRETRGVTDCLPRFDRHHFGHDCSHIG